MQFIKICFVQVFCVSFYLFLISSVSSRSLPFMSFTVPIFGQNVPLISPVFLKRSLVFTLRFFLLVLCTVHWRRPSCLSLLFFGTLCLVGCTFPFLPCFLFLFFLHLFVKPPQITTLPSCFSFFWGAMVLFTTSIVVLWAHCLLDLIPWIYLLPPLHIHRVFDLSCSWLA